MDEASSVTLKRLHATEYVKQVELENQINNTFDPEAKAKLRQELERTRRRMGGYWMSYLEAAENEARHNARMQQ